MTVREPAATPTIVTQSRLAQTDPWIPSPVSDKPADDSNNEFQTMMQARVEALERKYQTIIEQKNSQIQQLTQEVFKKQIFPIERILITFVFFQRRIHNKRISRVKWKNM